MVVRMVEQSASLAQCALCSDDRLRLNRFVEVHVTKWSTSDQERYLIRFDVWCVTDECVLDHSGSRRGND